MRRSIKAAVHGLQNLLVPPHHLIREKVHQLYVLTWHRFSNQHQHNLMQALPIDLFSRQVDWLIRNFQVVTLDEGLLRLLSKPSSQTTPMVALTIDDGFKDNWNFAYPILKAKRVPATIYVATEFIDTERAPWPTQLRWIIQETQSDRLLAPDVTLPLTTYAQRDAAALVCKKLLTPMLPNDREVLLNELAQQLRVNRISSSIAPLTWQEIRQMSEYGITIGAHSHYHSILPEMPVAVAEYDIALSKIRVESELGRVCNHFAYPDGKHNRVVREAVKASGFTCAVTQDTGTNTSEFDAFRIARVDIPYHDPIQTFFRRVATA